MEIILNTLQNKTVRDIDPNLVADLLRRSIRTFKRLSSIILWSGRTLEDVRDYLLEQAGRGRLGRAMNLAGDGDNILKCKEMVDNNFKDFQVCSPGLLSITVFNTFIDVYVHLAPIGYGGLA